MQIARIVSRWLKKHAQENWLLDDIQDGPYLVEDVNNFLASNAPRTIASSIGEQIDPVYDSFRNRLIEEGDIIVFIEGAEDYFGKVSSIEFEEEETGTYRVDIELDQLETSGAESTISFSILADEEAASKELYLIDKEDLIAKVLGT